MATFFPGGQDGACHPLNVGGFDLGQPGCAALYAARDGLHEEWQLSVEAHARLAREGWNCSSVQECALGQLFLRLGAWTTAGFWGLREPHIRYDPWRFRLWEQMSFRARQARKRELLLIVRQRGADLREATATLSRAPPPPGDVTLGIHSDLQSATGRWRGQLELWKAYAQLHGLRWLLDTEQYFTGKVFARYYDMHWASADSSRNGFWRLYPFLAHHDTYNHPLASFSEGTIKDALVLGSLAIFTQPPSYWDSLEALRVVLPLNKWTFWIDYDLTISPCCFDVYSFAELISPADKDYGGQDEVELPHVILRDSPREDYSHHCANAGFLGVRNSAVGRLFVDLAHSKRMWPGIPYGYQGALAESLLELLGLEKALAGGKDTQGQLGYDGRCLPHLVLGSPIGTVSYANYCQCYRAELVRLAGPEGARRSRWVRFLEARHGQEVGLLLASLFIFRTGGQGRGQTRGVGVLPLTTWSRDRHRAYADAWLPGDFELGGPCALLPLIVHWASLPWRPGLIYEFLHARFPRELPLDLLSNGTAEALTAAYRAAGARGREIWNQFVALHPALRASVSWPAARGNTSAQLERAACNLGSARMWEAGGYTRRGRSTNPYGPFH